MQEQGISFEFRGNLTALSPEELLMRELELMEIREAISCLSEEDQRLIRGLFWEEKTQCQLAAELDITQPAVAARRKQALKKLRKMLQD